MKSNSCILLISALAGKLPRPQDPVIHAVTDGGSGVHPSQRLLSSGWARHASCSVEQGFSTVLSKGTYDGYIVTVSYFDFEKRSIF